MKMMKTYFTAFNVPVLNFRRLSDLQGNVIPPEAYAEFPTSIAVTYGPPDVEHVAGHANIRRVGNQLLADMTLLTTADDAPRYERVIRKLYPALSIEVNEAVDSRILKFTVEELFLTPFPNVDTTIEQLGDRLMIKPPARKGMH